MAKDGFDVAFADPGDTTSPRELRRAYRRALIAAHPDHGGSREQLEQVRIAYERLVDGTPARSDPSQETEPARRSWVSEHAARSYASVAEAPVPATRPRTGRRRSHPVFADVLQAALGRPRRAVRLISHS